ncbi:hypothetical protein JRQ81_005646 [Phrynocephalus forsythii]|uniref:Uncharacterized protein n=1 Tax=Phrynocephalus forsythii TaxID=171643 RepID=A0A9Q1AVC3_9SAUR|nr:hypothetical protein JRQ81_005646 [Phrynocephalus forsythii]
MEGLSFLVLLRLWTQWQRRCDYGNRCDAVQLSGSYVKEEGTKVCHSHQM